MHIYRDNIYIYNSLHQWRPQYILYIYNPKSLNIQISQKSIIITDVANGYI